MADKQVDTRGLSCPQPVVVTRRALDSISSGVLEVLTDTVTSRENIIRMASKLRCDVQVEDLPDGEFRLKIAKA